MTTKDPDSLTCPTRPGGAPPLIVHTIDTVTCAERQAANYHRCGRCVHQSEASCSDAAALPEVIIPRPEPLDAEEHVPMAHSIATVPDDATEEAATLQSVG